MRRRSWSKKIGTAARSGSDSHPLEISHPNTAAVPGSNGLCSFRCGGRSPHTAPPLPDAHRRNVAMSSGTALFLLIKQILEIILVCNSGDSDCRLGPNRTIYELGYRVHDRTRD